MGTNPSARFKQIENQQGYTPQDEGATKSRVTTAMVFDYTALKERYEISLDILSGYSDEEDSVSLAAAPEAEDMPLFGDGA